MNNQINLKDFVGIFLVAFILIFVNIVLFGIGGEMFTFLYSVFMLILAFFSITFLRKSFDSKIGLIIAIFFGLIIVISVTFCASAFKSNYDISEELSVASNELYQENLLADEKNNYYIKYINYTLAKIAEYKNNTARIQSEIDEIEAINLQIVSSAAEEEVPIVIQPVYYYQNDESYENYKNYENSEDYEEKNDD
jgi:hypothetical protein